MAPIGTHRPDASQLDPFEDSAATAAHIERVLTIADGQPPESPDDEVATSWQRSANAYRVDPASAEPPRILTSSELKDSRDPLAKLIIDASGELDRLYKLVRRARYTVLLCDVKGIAVDHRGDPTEADHFRYWGTWLGGVWAEDVEGTNGIGTCIAEERPVSIHQSQHFRARHISLSCSGAPIFGSDGKLVAILDVSSIDPELSEQSHFLTGALTEASARAIEERSFRERFRREWIIAVVPPDRIAPAMLIAVDRHQIVVGADRNARLTFSRHNPGLENGASLWSFFERQRASLFRKDQADVPTGLRLAGSAELWPALITAPGSGSNIRRDPEAAALHTRPRLDSIESSLPQLVLPLHTRGGLPPRALQRVRDYIDFHLKENIGLEELAATADLSMFHFARVFKQSQGITPHSFLLQRRIERAQELLAHSDMSLSEIAGATGFSDQSHLARQFRARVGVSPSAFRWSKR
jgi:AraC-like DNA-binding protein